MRTFRRERLSTVGHVSSRTPMLLIVIASMCAFGQSSTRTVRGVVVDREGNALPAAVVQIEDLSSLQVRSFITMASGAYYFCDLNPDRDYRLRARYRRVWGPAKTLSRFNSRKEVTLNLEIDVRKEE